MNDTNITVVDSVMGSGKSTWAIGYMNEHVDQDFIVVVPTLSEIDRYKLALEREVYVPNEDEEIARLLEGFNIALSEGRTIITTHALLSYWDDTSVDLIQKGDYVLVLDEVINVVTPFPITADDFNGLLETEKVQLQEVDGLQKVIATPGATYEGKQQRFMEQVRRGNVYRVDDAFCVWLSGPSKLAAFEQVYILTYLFEGQVMSGWMKLFDLAYDLKTIRDGQLISYTSVMGMGFADLITIIEDQKLNAIGQRHGSLSSNWYKKAKKESFERLKTNTRAFFRSRSKTRREENLWTVFKDYQRRIEVSPFSRPMGVTLTDVERMSPAEKAESDCFLGCNAKATNLYRHKTALAYLINVFPNPALVKLFANRGIPFDQDLYALSEMLQWIWRSQVRDGKPIVVYVPSRRMRMLFKRWLALETGGEWVTEALSAYSEQRAA